MGYLGFLFEIEQDKLEILSLNKTVKKNIVIFIELEKIKGNFIIGVNKFIEDENDFLYLDKDYNLQNFLVFERSNFKIGKISTNDKTIVDFEFLTFWFNGENYRIIRETLLIDEKIIDLEFEIKNRVKCLINFFV